MNQNWSTVVTDWQGVDEELKPESKNLIESGSVYDSILNYNIDGKIKLLIGNLSNNGEPQPVVTTRAYSPFLIAPFSLKNNSSYVTQRIVRYNKDTKAFVDYIPRAESEISVTDTSYIYRITFKKTNDSDFLESELSNVTNFESQYKKAVSSIPPHAKSYENRVIDLNFHFFAEENTIIGSYINQAEIASGNYVTFYTYSKGNGILYVNSHPNYFFRLLVGKGTPESHVSTYYANIDSLPSSSSKWDVEKGDLIAITIAKARYNELADFSVILEINEETDVFGNTFVTENAKKYPNKIIVHYVDSTQFCLIIPQRNNGKVLKHYFIHQYNVDEISYGAGLSKNIITADIWYPNYISWEDNNIAQGNLNFIYRLQEKEGFENENSFVGAGHGCEVKDFQLFYADGVSVDVSQPFYDIECETFRIVTKAYNYAIDTSATGFDPMHTLPKLTEDGNPIITAIHTYTAEYNIDNIISWENNLNIKRNNVTFSALYSGMVQGNYPYFSRIMLEDSNYNAEDYLFNNNDVVVSPIGGSAPMETGYNAVSESLTLIGNGFLLSQKQKQGVARKDKNTCILQFYNNPNRLKVYMIPVKTTASGNPEIFNDGDSICVNLVRKMNLK